MRALIYDDRVLRLELRLDNESEWIKVFDPRCWTVFVACAQTASPDEPVRLEVVVGGWAVTLHGLVVTMRSEPDGIVVALSPDERDKINYLNGFVRGGLLNMRARRRLEVRLPVTYGAVEGPAKTFTKDLGEEGTFLLTDNPLPETSQLHMLITVPGRADPLSVRGSVSHVILPDDELPAGMGVVFLLDDAQRALLGKIVAELGGALAAGELPDPAA